ncbi:MAG: TonB-dependent receptor [Prevotella sp.]|nr:TonB-dependent receptor [Prevotella sp.]
MRKWILICLMLLICSIVVEAQTKITGRVMDGAMAGEPLIGATIQVPGTSVGAISDLDGNFSFDIPEGKFIIQISMIGYKTQVVNVKGKTQIEVTLQEDAAMMEDVVVVGYGTMKKRDLSGSVSQIKSDDLMKGGAVDVAHGLQGKIAGVQVQQSDGSPGAGVSITVRGANSFTTSSQPLYIVDGIPFGTDPNGAPSSDANSGNNQQTSPLSMINPNDIEKIEVLKDASATAIYGSRGANGVVIITTKKGQTGKPVVEASMKWTMSKRGKKVKMLDPYHYALYQNEANENSVYYEGGTQRNPYRGEWTYPYTGGSFIYTQGTYNPSPEDFLNPGQRTDEYGNVDYVEGADWQDEIYQTGWAQEYNASVSGGSDKGWYAFSGSYTKQDGIIKNTGYKRYGLSINISRHITNWLEIGTSSHFTNATTDFQRTNSENTAIIRSALIFPPTTREESDQTDWLAANPVNYVNGATDRLKQISWFSSSFAEAKITSWLKFRQNLGLGYNDGHRNTYYNRLTQEGKSPINGKAGKATNTWKSFTSESLLTADKTFGIHKLNAVAGVTFESGRGESMSMTATNFPNDLTRGADISMALDRPVVKSDPETKMNLESFLARLNYTLLDKYLFTASVRTDGSSAFRDNKKWATFLSGAFAWRAIDEKFIQDLNFFSNLKFRLSYGETGNQGIGAYRTLAVLQAANYPYNGSLSSGMSMIDWRGPQNPNLKWETTAQFNAGIDFGWLNNRLQLTVDYYYKKTRDLLQNVTIPSSSGFSQQLVNSGNVTNEGLELTLSFDVLRNSPVKWNFVANMAFNKNRIGGLDGDQYATALWSKADQVFLQRNGCPIGTLYGYVEDGFYDNIAEVRSNKAYAGLSDAEAMRYVGEIKYRDLNGDGQITQDDRTIIGDTNPDFTYSFTNNVSYKDFTLSFMLQGSHGNDIFNYNLTDITMSNIGNITADAYNSRWTAETAETAKWPKATAGYTRTWLVSDRYVEDGSYLKMKYVTLSYDWKRPIKGIEKIAFSLTANNLFTITDYSWFDPDVNAGGQNAACPGVDSYSYPSARSFAFGINFTF